MKTIPLALALAGLGCSAAEPIDILVFSKTTGFRHASIEAGHQALQNLAQERGARVTVTENAAVFAEDSLRQYDVVVFLSTTEEILDEAQQFELMRYVRAGGGWVGIHAAADTEYEWPWYGQLVGGYFDGHPSDPGVREAVLTVTDADHPSTRHLPSTWTRSDEWYDYRDRNPNVRVLLTIDEASYRDEIREEPHPIAWYHEYDGGRAFYTGLGHTAESYSEPAFLDHVWGGIVYAAGEAPVDYASAAVPPPESAFTTEILADNLYEPMELDLLDDGRVLFIERRGTIKLYDPTGERLDTVATMPVWSGEEDGLLGLAVDPAYARTNWIYLFYSPPGDDPKQRISRFDFEGDQLDVESERVLLEVPVQRVECCHAAGGLEFGPDGTLYIATGDNTNPFSSNGFAPIDERPGRTPWDAQGSSANTDDLRGKILRIQPEPDGSYTIPEGNLFPADGSAGRPEIFAMGLRNPFRMNVDPATGVLYWGDIGPDANEPDATRGPAGHDEINRASGPGFFGWPYFVADNKPYVDYDFATSESGTPFDPAAPQNDSPNNTGQPSLPPAQPAWIWYPYTWSREFPMVGQGGRSAMAGPVYRPDPATRSAMAFPAYFEGRLFIHEWMRGWVMTVSVDGTGMPTDLEPFLPSLDLANPVDMVFTPQGTMYLLEYGTQWFAQNEDARLRRITYRPGP